MNMWLLFNTAAGMHNVALGWVHLTAFKDKQWINEMLLEEEKGNSVIGYSQEKPKPNKTLC